MHYRVNSTSSQLASQLPYPGHSDVQVDIHGLCIWHTSSNEYSGYKGNRPKCPLTCDPIDDRIYLLYQLKLTSFFHLCAGLLVSQSVSHSVKTKLIQVIITFCWFQSVESNAMRGVRTYWTLTAYSVSGFLPPLYYVKHNFFLMIINSYKADNY